MRYKVAGLLKAPTGATREAELDAPITLDAPDVRVRAPARGWLRFLRDDAGVFVEGQLTTSVGMLCARCLEPVQVGLTFELSEHFRPTVRLPGGPPIDESVDRDAATLIDGQHVLDLGEVVRQAALLALPLHPLCRPECAGLCSLCGQDLNVGECGCEPEPDPRWDGLRALLEES